MLCNTHLQCKEYQALIKGINEGAAISGLELEYLRQHLLFCSKCKKKLTPEAEKLVYGDEEEIDDIDIEEEEE